MSYPYFPNGYFPYQTGGAVDYPSIGNVLDTDTVGGVSGTYHAPDVGEVRYGAAFGPLSALTGTYGQSALGDEDSIIKELFKAIYSRFSVVTNDLNTDVGGRFYKDIAPDNPEYPYVVYSMISDVPDKTFTEDMEDVYIQFSLFSNSSSSTEIEDMYSHLKELYDECQMVPTGSDLVWMKRENATRIDSDEVTTNGTTHIYGYAVDYIVKISKH
jgi:hypothetical protein